MTTTEFLSQPMQAIIEAGPAAVQAQIDETVSQLAALRSLLTVTKAAKRPNRKQSPERKRKAQPAAAAVNGESS